MVPSDASIRCSMGRLSFYSVSNGTMVGVFSMPGTRGETLRGDIGHYMRLYVMSAHLLKRADGSDASN